MYFQQNGGKKPDKKPKKNKQFLGQNLHKSMKHLTPRYSKPHLLLHKSACLKSERNNLNG